MDVGRRAVGAWGQGRAAHLAVLDELACQGLAGGKVVAGVGHL